MKRTLLVIGLILSAILVNAQTPDKMSFQAVIRDGSDNLVTNQNIGMRMSIVQDSVNGSAVYVETHSPTTNANGLASLEIGNGSVVSGSFNSIDWSSGPYFLKTETDPSGGTTYSITGAQQLLSVPYAQHASSADNLSDMAAITSLINEKAVTTIPLWQAGSSYNMSNTSGADLSNCETGMDPTKFDEDGDLQVALVIRITSTSAGTTNFQLRAHDGTTEIYPIVNTDSWTYTSTQYGLVATSEWKDFLAGTNAHQLHLFGWVDSGATNFNSAYLMVRPKP